MVKSYHRSIKASQPNKCMGTQNVCHKRVTTTDDALQITCKNGLLLPKEEISTLEGIQRSFTVSRIQSLKDFSYLFTSS